MTKKAKKRQFDEIESNNEHVNNKKKENKDSPNKKNKVGSDDSTSKNEKLANVLKDSQELELPLQKLKKRKNKKNKKDKKVIMVYNKFLVVSCSYLFQIFFNKFFISSMRK